ncbi:uncharacterized protein [Nicotiana tomentosiformis]|uniref:uncharacterized protein n=1 Tax=Nicotiana tomentosiformis TaxID=4098 RepID=UPI00388CC7CB
MPLRGCFERGDTRHIVRDCPRLWMGELHQGTQAMILSPYATPPAQPTRDGGHTGMGHPRERGQARCYAFPSRTEAIALDAVITDMSHDSLDKPVYVSTHAEDSIMVDRVYRSCLVIIGGYEIRVDYLLLNMVDLDVVLGMDWLSSYHAILDCHAKTVTLAMPALPRLEWRGSLGPIPVE